MESIEKQPQATAHSTDNLYCSKCRSHTDNVDPREEQITSKGKPRFVIEATCAVCTKKKKDLLNQLNQLKT